MYLPHKTEPPGLGSVPDAHYPPRERVCTAPAHCVLQIRDILTGKQNRATTKKYMKDLLYLYLENRKGESLVATDIDPTWRHYNGCRSEFHVAGIDVRHINSFSSQCAVLLEQV